MISKVPFYSNSTDNTHCYQAVIRMVLGYYFPTEDFTWEQLDEITGKQSGKWSWPIKGLLYLAERGLDVKYIGTFDYQEFAEDGEKYLRKKYASEVAEAQIKNSDIPQEMQIANRAAGKVKQDKIKPTIEMLRQFGNEGNLQIVNVNYRALYGKEGFVGHFVLVSEIGEEVVVLHDPGLPANEEIAIPMERFLTAWQYSGSENAGVITVGLKTKT